MHLQLGHIFGIPIEESLGSFSPALFAVLVAFVVTLRARFRAGRSRIADAHEHRDQSNGDPVSRATGSVGVTRR